HPGPSHASGASGRLLLQQSLEPLRRRAPRLLQPELGAALLLAPRPARADRTDEDPYLTTLLHELVPLTNHLEYSIESISMSKYIRNKFYINQRCLHCCDV